MMGCIDSEDEKDDPKIVNYTKLKLNEVSGVRGESEKFYEFKNIVTKDIPY